MPTIENIHVFCLTRTGDNDPETDDPIQIIITNDDMDVVDHLGVLNPTSLVPGGAIHGRLLGADWDDAQFYNKIVSPYASIRICVAGCDAWRPKSIIVFAETTTHALVPLGCDLGIERTLSAQSSDGKPRAFSSMPVRRVRFDSNELITRLIVLVDTADEDWAGTPNDGHLTISVNGDVKTAFPFPDTVQGDLGRGRTNFYIGDVLKPFSRPRQSDVFQARLSINGDNRWEVEKLYVFGMIEKAGTPTSLIPLVHEPQFKADHGFLSTDREEGCPYFDLALAPQL